MQLEHSTVRLIHNVRIRIKTLGTRPARISPCSPGRRGDGGAGGCWGCRGCGSGGCRGCRGAYLRAGGRPARRRAAGTTRSASACARAAARAPAHPPSYAVLPLYRFVLTVRSGLYKQLYIYLSYKK